MARGTYSRHAPDPARVARALLDAELLGDKAAAKRHGVHYKTIVGWRRERQATQAVDAELKRLRAAVSDDWIEEARRARRAIIARMVELAETNKNLRAVTEAGRRINEMVMAHEVLHEDPGAAADALADDAHQREDPGAAEGSRGVEGDDGPDDFGGGEG